MSSNDSNRSRKLLVPLATMAVAATVVVGSGATWTSTTQSSVSVTSGNILHSNSKGAKTLSVSNIKPGDTVTGSLTITNEGSLDSRLQITELAGATNTFYKTTTAPIKSDLQLVVKRGTTTIYSGDFDKFTAYDSGATDKTAALPKADPNSTSDEALITFAVSLAANADDSSQGKAADATFKFTTTPLDGETGLAGLWN
jgi:spore coat-associated protein N